MDSNLSAIVFESISPAWVMRAGIFPSAKLLQKNITTKHSLRLFNTGRSERGGVYISLRCLLMAASQSKTESSTMLWPMPFSAHETLHSNSGAIPGLRTTLTKSSGSRHNSPSRNISTTAWCNVQRTVKLTLTHPNHVPNGIMQTYNDSVNALNNNEPAFFLHEVDQGWVDISLHIWRDNVRAISFQNL